ncbi:alpha/beta hydrolase [Elusimicrobiota bacterium]
MLKSCRHPVARSPQDYAMQYEDIEFRSSDGLTLQGWRINGNTNKLFIIAHPMFMNRHGFIAEKGGAFKLFKKNIFLLKLAGVLNKEGHSVIAFDFRNHGASDSKLCGFGSTEYQDIFGIMDYIDDAQDLRKKDICCIGLGSGANAIITAFGEGRARLKRVKCIIAVQPTSAVTFLNHYISTKFNALLAYLVYIIDRIMQMRAGVSIMNMSPEQYAQDVFIPTLYVQAEFDPWVDMFELDRIAENNSGQIKKWIIEDQALEEMDVYNYISEHPDRIFRFLEKYF